MENYNYTIIQEKENNNIKYYKVTDNFTNKTLFIEEYLSVGYSDWDTSDKITEQLKKLQKEEKIVEFFDETNFVEDKKIFFKVYFEDNFNYKSIFDSENSGKNTSNIGYSFDIENSNNDIENSNDDIENSSFKDDHLIYNNYLKENYLEKLEERAFSSFKDNPQSIKRKERERSKKFL